MIRGVHSVLLAAEKSLDSKARGLMDVPPLAVLPRTAWLPLAVFRTFEEVESATLRRRLSSSLETPGSGSSPSPSSEIPGSNELRSSCLRLLVLLLLSSFLSLRLFLPLVLLLALRSLVFSLALALVPPEAVALLVPPGLLPALKPPPPLGLLTPTLDG